MQAKTNTLNLFLKAWPQQTHTHTYINTQCLHSVLPLLSIPLPHMPWRKTPMENNTAAWRPTLCVCVCVRVWPCVKQLWLPNRVRLCAQQCADKVSDYVRMRLNRWVVLSAETGWRKCPFDAAEWKINWLAHCIQQLFWRRTSLPKEARKTTTTKEKL